MNSNLQPRQRAGKLRQLTALTATFGLLVLGTFALATDAYAIQFDCGTRWVKFYGTFQSGTSTRWYCASGDIDMSSEPGNVMGPLGDGSGGTLDDFDAVNGTSGISSYTWKDSSGDYFLCLYDGTNYTGTFMGDAATGTIHVSLEGNPLNNKISSFKIVLGTGFDCPNV